MGFNSIASRSASVALAVALGLCLAGTLPASARITGYTRTATAEPDPAPRTGDPAASDSDSASDPDYRPAEKEEPAAAAPVVAPEQPTDTVAAALLAHLKDGKPLLPRLDPKLRENFLAFYGLVDFKPVWIKDGAFTASAKSVMARLRAAGEDGLDPRAYPIPSLPTVGQTSDAQIVEAELKLSASVVSYARDARGGRINYATLTKLITPHLDLPSPEIVLGQLFVSDDEAGNRLQFYNPHNAGYLALKARLASLRGVMPAPIAADSSDTPSDPNKTLRLAVGPVLKVGMRDPRVPQLRAFFALPAAKAGTLDAPPGEADEYDQAVSDAVAKFQTRRGIPANGNLNRSTIVALAIPEPAQPVAAPLLAQRTSAHSGDEALLLVNMERWRWLPSELGSDYILVNVPEYRLRAYRAGVIRDETRVIVGKPETPTPLFSGAMEYAVVNPSWFVPPSILKTMRGTGGFQVVGRGKNIGLRQPPGPRNALGYIKMMFPNQHSVYLHDTPNRSLFSASKRAFSHGCVRVDNPFRLAAVALQDWSEPALRKLIGRGERTIKLGALLPVHINYFTAYVDDAGTFRTLPDLYGYDRKMKTALGLVGEPTTMAALPAEPKRDAGAPAAWPANAVADPAAGRGAAPHGTLAGRHGVGPSQATAPKPAPDVRREATRTPAYRPAASRYRRAPEGYGEPGLWTPQPQAPRFWW